MYTTLKTKLNKYRCGDKLPIHLLKSLAEIYPNWVFSKIEPAENKKVLLNSLVVNDRIVDWRFHSVADESEIGYDTIVELINGDKSYLNVNDHDFFKDLKAEEYLSGHFKLLQRGRMAIAGEDMIYGVTEHDLFMNDSQDHMLEGLNIAEGTPLMVLETLIVGKTHLVKFLLGDEVRWTYGILYDKEYFDIHDNENHWI